ncbi:MAG TPA: hypothetical protein VFA74_01635 [Terriglobales bacterium]|nr:hypothetical protein [Terriglobales bacterium]
MPIRRDDEVEQLIQEMKRDLYALYTERTAIDRRMDTIKKGLVGLATLYGREALSLDFLQCVDPAQNRKRTGITEMCRSIIKESHAPLSSTEIHRKIKETNPDLLITHKNPGASVQTVLRRLVKQGQAQVVSNKNGELAWKAMDNPAEDCRGRESNSIAQERPDANRILAGGASVS